jgi:hypothetical protein
MPCKGSAGSTVGETGLALGALNAIWLGVGVGNTSSSEMLLSFSVLVGSQQERVSA